MTTRYFVLSAVSATMLMFAGCGDKAPETNTEVSATGAESTVTAQDNSTLTINNGAEIASLDPHKTGGVPESNVARQQFIGLTTTDVDGNLIGGVAEHWESDDNLVWRFHLKDTKWSDGSPLTADDVVFSLQRVVDPDTAANFANYLADAKILNALDIIEGKKDKSALGVKALDLSLIHI